MRSPRSPRSGRRRTTVRPGKKKVRCGVPAQSVFPSPFAVPWSSFPTSSLSTPPADHDDFKNKRKDHYNMKAAMDRARRLMEEEDQG